MAAIGQTLSHYKIIDKLGQGGMGEVYRATDLTLGRDVAITVLPEEFASHPDRIARFQSEAKLLASLNHPNIAAIYGLEQADGTNFLVLELVEGETLADQLKRARSVRDSYSGHVGSESIVWASLLGLASVIAVGVPERVDCSGSSVQNFLADNFSLEHNRPT